MSVSVIGSSSSGGNAFNVAITTAYSVTTLPISYPASSYSFTSALNASNMDVYLVHFDGTIAGYTNTKAITPTQSFNKIIVLGGTTNDILTFNYTTTYSTTQVSSDTEAGPVLISATPSLLPNDNATTTVTGANFATNITATFTGTDSVARSAKSIVYGSPTSLILTRPDIMPDSAQPYSLTVSNPGVANPTASNANTLSNYFTTGSAPVWTTGATLPYTFSGSTVTLVATTSNAGSSITYSLVSGSLPTGASLGSTSGIISPITVAGTWTFTVAATDSGQNSTNRTFTLITGAGGTLKSDATYYYQLFTGTGSFSTPVSSLTADILVVAGGGGNGPVTGAGGAGGLQGFTSQTLTNSSYAVTVGSGGTGAGNGSNSQFGALTASVGGGAGGVSNGNGNAGGSGGGAGEQGAAQTPVGGAGTSGQGFAGGNNPGLGCSPTGGGGGATAAGASGTSAGSGVGGQGSSAYSSWGAACGVGDNRSGTYYFAGGGGGGSYCSNPNVGGYGGGGNGVNNNVFNAGNNGATNTGGGCGGGGQTNTSGGSGVVIVRYTRSQVGG